MTRLSKNGHEKNARDKAPATAHAKKPRKKSGRRTLGHDAWEFLWERKAWWMLPSVLVLFLMGILVVASKVPVLAPFIYALF